jgi:WD40 repeat protein/serine/threonine protein kinase
MRKPDEETIFNVARHINAPEARRLYIEQSCADDPVVQERVEALLQVYDQEQGFLESPAEGILAADQFVGEGPGSQIGPYKLMEQIGEGGFGVVFLAEQQQPVRRKVAFKILKPGMDSRQIVARFEAERQALALMNHPNIAHVLDGGAADSGRPYFVMDLVKGIPITKYCDEHQLTLRERLVLFLPVCQAVQHAHQKGLIHRDLKPTNVLIAMYDGRPVPKVIDFGVAKALGQPLTDRTLFTGFASLIGTLEYMSPEQAEFNAQDIDTRADIYSLGVLLYELLTGTTPLTKQRMEEVGTTELLRLIREEEPPKPSSRISQIKFAKPPAAEGVARPESSKGVAKEQPLELRPSKTPGVPPSPTLAGSRTDAQASIAAQRRLDPARFSKEIRGELDWIVMKCLEKDRARRYQTANGLARDIERYLNEEAVEACPPSVVYRVRKFAGKYRKLFWMAAAFVFLLAASAVISSWLAFRATQAEHTSNLERDRAEAEAKRSHRNLYDAEMRLAQSAWEEARIQRVLELLERHGPASGDEDLQGFEWHYLRRQIDNSLLTLAGHRDLITSVAFSPDSKRLASASFDTKVMLWDAQTGRVMSTFNGHTAAVTCVEFSPDGSQLASGAGRTVLLWDANNGRILHRIQGHKFAVPRVAFSPDGKRLASASHDGTAKVWDTATGMMTLEFKGHSDLVHGVAFGPDGRWIASASKDKTVKVWDAVTGVVIQELRGHLNEVKCVAFSLDGKQVASGSLDRTVRVWDLASGRETLRGHHADRVFGVAFSPDGKRVASASVDTTLRIWNVASGEEMLNLRGHLSWVSSVAFSPDGKRLASGSHDQTVKLWDVARREETMMMRAPQQFLGVAFSPDGQRLASSGEDGHMKVWDASSGLEILTLPRQKAQVQCVAFSPDGNWLASACRDKSVRVWDAQTGRQIWDLKGPTEQAWTVAFSPDGKQLAAGSFDKTVRVWDLASGQETLTLHHSGPVFSVAFNPDGRRLASASADKLVRVWNTTSGQQTLILKGHTRGVTGVAFSPDGRWLASGSADSTVRIWDATSGEELQRLEGHIFGVNCVAFSPDGIRLASSGGSIDNTVKVWDTISGQETLTLKGHTYGIPCLAFSPDGQRLASAGYDNTLRVWDARPWTPQLRIEHEARNLIAHLRADLEQKAEMIRLIGLLFGKVGEKAAVIRQIEHDPSLSAEVRQEALEMTKRWQEDSR